MIWTLTGRKKLLVNYSIKKYVIMTLDERVIVLLLPPARRDPALCSFMV